MDISCAFPPAPDTPAWVELAEHLGFGRAWLYDSPAVYPDVWVSLARCADRTTRIGLGPGVLIPSLRHPMVNAAAITELAVQAPGRVAVAVGAGFSGRLAMGQPPMRWRDVETYVRALRGLLAGEDVEWDGKALRMLHLPGYGAPRPLDVPILIGAEGPRGLEVAAEVGDGVFSVAFPQTAAVEVSPWRALLAFGTVLGEGENLTSPRVVEAIGPAAVGLYHATYERQGPDAVDRLPGGAAWRVAIEAVPEAVRHFAIHQGHLVETNERDRPHIGELAPLVGGMSLVGSPAQVRDKLDGLAEAGVTEVAYHPTGVDPERELRSFARAAGLVAS